MIFIILLIQWSYCALLYQQIDQNLTNYIAGKYSHSQHYLVLLHKQKYIQFYDGISHQPITNIQITKNTNVQALEISNSDSYLAINNNQNVILLQKIQMKYSIIKSIPHQQRSKLLMAFSQDDKFFCFTGPSKAVTILDTKTTITKNITLDIVPNFITFDHDGNLYVADSSSPKLYTYYQNSNFSKMNMEVVGSTINHQLIFLGNSINDWVIRQSNGVKIYTQSPTNTITRTLKSQINITNLLSLDVSQNGNYLVTISKNKISQWDKQEVQNKLIWNEQIIKISQQLKGLSMSINANYLIIFQNTNTHRYSLCPVAYFYNLEDDTCKTCKNSCQSCFNSRSKCYSCQAKYYLDGQNCRLDVSNIIPILLSILSAIITITAIVILGVCIVKKRLRHLSIMMKSSQKLFLEKSGDSIA